MSLARSLFPLVCIALAACSPPAQTNASGDATATQDTASAINAPAPSSCDSPAVGMAIGSTVNAEIAATQASYPENARYYCVLVPEGMQRLTLDLTGMTADLDLYVGHGAISSVQGVNIQAGETYEWKSNEYGTVDERVVIERPQPGIYYAEIVSYTGAQSPYQFSAR